ncbi:MAG: hypothetical protein H3C51_09605 [Rubellimicrobium sp.]|nr:hypothetical protein [Rubellimicrobium sp.]
MRKNDGSRRIHRVNENATRASAAALLLILLAGAGAAQERACIARVNGLDIAIAPGAILADPDPSLRERLLAWPGSLWNRAWGQPVACDSETTIAYLAGILALDEVEAHCLAEAPGDEGWLLVPGKRNFRGHCRVTVCERVNAAAGDGAGIARAVTRAATGHEVDSLGEGVTAFASASGAAMLTGRASLVQSALGHGAGALATALSTPAVAGAAAVTVMAAGSAVYLCRD